MFSSPAQATNNGLNVPSTSMGLPDSNGVQMHFSQFCTESEKVQHTQQETEKLDYMDLDYKPSVCNISPTGGMMGSMERNLADNFQGSTGLMRYHSAPSSFFASLTEDENNLVSQFFSGESSLTSQSGIKSMQQNECSPSSLRLMENKPAKHLGEHSESLKMNAQHPSCLKRSAGNITGEDLSKPRHLVAILENGPDVSHDSFGTSQMSMMCHAQAPQAGRQLMNNSYQMNSVCGGPPDSSGGRPSSISPPSSKSTLIRHSSSPAGLLSRMASDVQGAFENGYPAGTIRNSMGMASSCTDMVVPNRLHSQMNCLRQNSSPAELLTQLTADMGIPEIVDRISVSMGGSAAENRTGSSSDDGSLGNGNGGQGYISNFSVGSWEDATMLPGNFAGMQNGTNFAARKRVKELDGKLMPGLNNPDPQKGEPVSHTASALMNHQFSMPNSTSSEFAMEEFLQDSVPCKIRAKRGCATHPRSIAERVRRTRISERMRKLQELVPNMDKQSTNTADMLDEAVEYVKSLQKQVQELSEYRAKCTCIHGLESAAKTL